MSGSQRRLLVLAAGPLQVPLIQAARARGLHVTTADNRPSNPGHALADESIDISTRDVDRLCRAARERGIEAVLTCASDVAVPAVAAVAAALGLPGVSPAIAEAWHRKDRFRAFQRRHGLRAPGHVSGSHAGELAREARVLPGPWIVKPADRSGSRAVRKVAKGDERALEPAIEAALAASFCGRACVEQYLPGEEFGGDAVVWQGAVVHFFATRKRMEGCLVRGHELPSGLPPDGVQSLVAAVQAHVDAADLEAAIVNVDLRRDADGNSTVVEMSPRLGGNGIASLVRHACGFDLHGCALDLALGEAPDLEPAEITRPATTHVLGAATEGIVASRLELVDLREEIPELVDLWFDRAPGEPFGPFRDSGDQLGRALLRGNGRQAEAIAARLDAQVMRRVAP